MKQFSLKLGTSGQLELIFDIANTDIANRWADEIAKNYPLHEVDRFKGFGGKDFDYYLKQIQDQILIVNNYAPGTISCQVDKSQEVLNYLHTFFENLRGEYSTGTPFYNSAPATVKHAVDSFNVLIHELEHYTRDNLYPELVCTYQSPRYDLKETDYNQFTFKWEFGCVYINYCEVGKPLLDVFKDNDVVVGNSNVRPLKYYKSDFVIKFGPNTTDEIYEQRLSQFNKWYASYPLKFNKLSLGMIPVARINLKNSGFSNNKEVIDSVSSHRMIHSTCIK
jgi:hypothetical protein